MNGTVYLGIDISAMWYTAIHVFKAYSYYDFNFNFELY